MPSLIVVGNPNQHTFANSIVAANHKAIELLGKPLTKIFVLHSAESDARLLHERDWLAHLAAHHIYESTLIPRIIEIGSTPASIERFAEYIEFILRGGGESEQVIVDLSNGTTLHRSLLSIVAYVLDIKYQFLIDTVKLFQATSERGFLNLDVLAPSYVAAPNSTHLDSLAYINLAEMVRYRRRIASETDRYQQINPIQADPTFFRDNLLHSVKFKLLADRDRDNALYRIAAAAVSVSIDGMLELLVRKLDNGRDDPKDSGLTLGQKLTKIRKVIERQPESGFDLEFLEKFSAFVLYLRNSATHKGRLLTDSEGFKAELSVLLSLPFVRYYTEIVHPLVAPVDTPSAPVRRLLLAPIPPDETFYFGLDGDDTGKVFEDLFLVAGDEQQLQKASNAVSEAIGMVAGRIKQITSEQAIIYQAGDDILFKGQFTQHQLEELHDMYETSTSGMTCCIGYGRSLRDAFLALKLAKTSPGKNSIIGVELPATESLGIS